MADDVLCIGCGYNLRTLSRYGHCPECNAPVRASLSSGRLEHSNPDWLRLLRLGLRVSGISIATIVGSAFALFLWDLFVAPSPWRAFARIFLPFPLAGWVLGAFLLTRPEPFGRHLHLEALRRLIRLTGVFSWSAYVLTSVQHGPLSGLLLWVLNSLVFPMMNLFYIQALLSLDLGECPRFLDSPAAWLWFAFAALQLVFTMTNQAAGFMPAPWAEILIVLIVVVVVLASWTTCSAFASLDLRLRQAEWASRVYLSGTVSCATPEPREP